MHNSKSNVKTLKKALSKCKTRFLAYSDTQFKYADYLEANDEIAEVKCNVRLQGFSLGENYTSDFLCVKADKTMVVMETIDKKSLLKPKNLKLLEESRHYWLSRGIEWKLVLGVGNEKE